MSPNDSGRSYLVTSHGTLERIVQKRMAGKKQEAGSDHELKVIFPKAASEAIKHKMQYRARHTHKQVEPMLSLHLRDHVEVQAKHYPVENDHEYQKRSFNLNRWC